MTGRSADELILGVNYSGMHDTAVALVSREGEILGACALERLTRVKQDGRSFDALVEGLDWKKIAAVAVSTEKHFVKPEDSESALHPVRLASPRTAYVSEHSDAFLKTLQTLPAPKRFVSHQMSHAASAFYTSGFEDATCLSYDAGMCNCPWFGGLYDAGSKGATRGIHALDRFAASHYAKITLLYSFVTALLGFSPNKHEGKITGLAAYAEADAECRAALFEILTVKYEDLERLAEWVFAYSHVTPPLNVFDRAGRERLGAALLKFPPEVVAATLQELTEEHVLTILSNAKARGWLRDRICLAGGLFANVRVNQRVHEFGFSETFVAPPMTDEGTSLGAALAVAAENRTGRSRALANVFWGPRFGSAEIESALSRFAVSFEMVAEPENYVAAELARGATIALFQGRMEFGPRALGNRSILAEAKDPGINERLNKMLHRTEFMPFAPITREEDAPECYVAFAGAEPAMRFMTITVACSEKLRTQSPAVVHRDGTARPQIVNAESQPFLYAMLSRYKELTGIPSVINTSFNIHEEPIVCSPDDAIRGFLAAGIDLLYLEGGYIVQASQNERAALRTLYAIQAEGRGEGRANALAAIYSERLYDLRVQLEEKEQEIQTLAHAAAERLSALDAAHAEIGRLSAALGQPR